MPFVVHVERSAAAADGAVVDHGAQLAGHLLADAAAEGRNALAIEIRFQAVAHGFMQQDARPAGTQHHGHLAGRRIHRVQHGDGLARGFAGEMLRRLLVQEKIQVHAPAAAGVAALRRPAVLPRQRRNAHARQRLPVEREHAVAGRHQHVAQIVGIDRLHLKDARIVSARRAVGALHQFHALGERRLGGRRQHRIQIVLARLR